MGRNVCRRDFRRATVDADTGINWVRDPVQDLVRLVVFNNNNNNNKRRIYTVYPRILAERKTKYKC